MATATELKSHIDPKVLIRGDTTIWVSCPPQKTGFLVGIEKYGITIDTPHRDWERFTDAQKRAVRMWMNVVYQLHDYNNVNALNFDQCCCLGSWYEDGTLFLDACSWYSNYGAAMQSASEEHQVAIYSLEEKKVIYV